MTTHLPVKTERTPEERQKISEGQARRHKARRTLTQAQVQGQVALNIPVSGGGCIRRLRLQLGLTQAEFAEKVGLSSKNYSRVSYWEKGLEVAPERLARMYQLAEAAGIEWLYTAG